jgi:hypothetical protein
VRTKLAWFASIAITTGVALMVAGLVSPKSSVGTVGWVVLAVGVLVGLGYLASPDGAGPRPRIQIDRPRRDGGKAYQMQTTAGVVVGPSFATLVVGVRCTRGVLEDIRAEVTYYGLVGGHQLTTHGRWEHNAPQPIIPHGDDWSRFERITLRDGERDDLGVVLHYDGDSVPYGLDPRSWQMPLQHHAPDLRWPPYRLEPSGATIPVQVVIRAKRLRAKRRTYVLERVGADWMLKAA